MATKSKRPPWRRSAPEGARHRKLTKSQKSKAKTAAKRAGRRYPNLVDNMRAASKKSSSKRPKRKRRS